MRIVTHLKREIVKEEEKGGRRLARLLTRYKGRTGKFQAVCSFFYGENNVSTGTEQIVP